MLNNRNNNRSPFTPTQWQELEHQALIYKYMVSGVPIPSELIFSVKRSLESSLSSRIFPHQSIGWGCFQVGFGRKTDPEPGRCRRTDGKKWRCSKEAYPDSKYCERHMHRGRNRSRKPVEQLNNNTSSSTATSVIPANTIPATPSMNRNFSSSSSPSPSASPYSFSPLSTSPAESELFHTHQNTIRTPPFLYPHSSSRTSASGSTHNLFLDSGSSAHVDKDYRYFHGMREGSDEKAFFPESSSGNIRTLQDPYHSLAMGGGGGSYKSFSQSQFESLAAEATSKQQQDDHHHHNDQEQHCFVLGTDFKSPSSSSSAAAASARQMKLEKESDQTQKSLHHFFGEWPPKNSESWLDLSSSTSRLQTDG
ncbi:growth-regulating factor 5 [Euphorbia lathyris]|uniref:growth-regulating factor 5 n=1 Tax=Euphorbia lathyris TaxID=212925 RepID=UPI003313B3CD